MRLNIIDDDFIHKWHPLYDTIEDDEEDYLKIIATVKKEIIEKTTITKQTFIKILEWKAARLKGIIRLNEFDIYAEAIKTTIHLTDKQKLANLTNLHGIGVPLASTILHFLFPENFPIMDVRTAEVLWSAGYIESKQRDEKHYFPFRNAILNIQQKHPKWSLRENDRALFAYHKILFSQKCANSSNNPSLVANQVSHDIQANTDEYLQEASDISDIFLQINMENNEYILKINKIKKRINSGNYEALSGNQKKLYDVVKRMSYGDANQTLERKKIIKSFEDMFKYERSFESNRNMLKDFCYNSVNKDDKPNKFLFYAGPGMYRFVDFDWDPGNEMVDVLWEIKNFHKTFRIGFYKDKKFFWQFDSLIGYIKLILSNKYDDKNTLEIDAIRCFEKGYSFQMHGDCKKAIDFYTQSIDLYLSYIDFLTPEINTGKVITLSPIFVNAYYNRGTAYINIGNYHRAREDFLKVIEADRENVDAHIYHGFTCFELGDYEQAIMDFKKVIELNPGDTDAYYNLGVAHNSLGEHHLAIHNWKIAARLGSIICQDFLKEKGIEW